MSGFQTFSGNSRRPRQVNLSGRTANPFAAASGTERTVANAQQERQQRQHERERIIASIRIQRTWRGHKCRRTLADARRQAWDEQSNDVGANFDVLVQQVKLLVLFFSIRRNDDVKRLDYLSLQLLQIDSEKVLNHEVVHRSLPKLANILLESSQSSAEYRSRFLNMLLVVIKVHRDVLSTLCQKYYAFLSSIAHNSSIDGNLFTAAIDVPLTVLIKSDQDVDVVKTSTYAAFAREVLTVPYLETVLNLNSLASSIDLGTLSHVLSESYSPMYAEQIQPDHILWLLAHFIALHRFHKRDYQDQQYLQALSHQLSSCSHEIMARNENSHPNRSQHASLEDDLDGIQTTPLPQFIQEQLSSLVTKSNISGLLVKLDLDYSDASAVGRDEASFVASYVLTLLRIFPNRGDEIRMWLYHNSMSASTGSKVPALKFFWNAMSSTNTFSMIRQDPKTALNLLRSQKRDLPYSPTFLDLATDREWRLILLFLELYTFVLRFMDDEEFLSGDSQEFCRGIEPVSYIRDSALPIDDVKQLTIFLKNLAFTTIYYTTDLPEEGSSVREATLGSLFGPSMLPQFPVKQEEITANVSVRRSFAGIAGMTQSYLRTIVTGVIRMLYARDSRRRFLPKDHWLMTSQFNMEGFISAVVAEEERQHDSTEDGSDEEADSVSENFRRAAELIGTGSTHRARHFERIRINHQHIARQKVIAEVGPRLKILQNMPLFIPFETRVRLFRQFVSSDQVRRRGGSANPDLWRINMVNQAAAQGMSSHMLDRRDILARYHAKIRRNHVFQDAFQQYWQLGQDLKEPIQITFVDRFDTVEAGIDGGGVMKEFLTCVTNEAFRSTDSPSLFVTNDQNLLYPNPAILDQHNEILRQAGVAGSSDESKSHLIDVLMQYQFLGRLIGKCLYEGILVDISFASFFLLKWAASGTTTQDSGYRSNINDLRDLDEGLYQGLLKLKAYPGDVDDFALDFTITDNVSLPEGPTQTITRELMLNGSKVPVTNDNRYLYVAYVARHRLHVQPYRQTQAFLKGLGEIINPSWLSMFNQSELQTLVGGDSSQIDVRDLRQNTYYGGVYEIGNDGLEHPTVRIFWKVMEKLDDADRKKVVRYVTSTPRAPLLGFSQLRPKFCIRDAGDDDKRLPSTSTCVNLLKLPRYQDESVLREKLLYAVNSGAGFDLS